MGSHMIVQNRITISQMILSSCQPELNCVGEGQHTVWLCLADMHTRETLKVQSLSKVDPFLSIQYIASHGRSSAKRSELHGTVP